MCLKIAIRIIGCASRTLRLKLLLYTYQHGVSDEEDWGVVPDKVPVPFITVELAGKPTGVSGCVS